MCRMIRLLGALLLGATLSIGAARTGVASAADYVFKAETASITSGADAVIGVRLLNKASGKPVANAVIFQTRLDMSPDGMGEMTGKVTPLPSEEPGVYRFQAVVGMAGQWSLKLAAKVPGEQETVRGEVVVKATD
jgi:hypothetical protein